MLKEGLSATCSRRLKTLQKEKKSQQMQQEEIAEDWFRRKTNHRQEEPTKYMEEDEMG